MSRTSSVEQISTLISQLPSVKSGLKIDWRSAPKKVARIVKALINSKDGIVTLVSKASGVHNQILYAIMRGKTPDGSKEWKELREALSKMKCQWRGGVSKVSSTTLLPVTSESLTQVFSTSEVTKTKPVKKRKSKTTKSVADQVVSGKETSKVESKYFDLESKELVVVVTTRYTLKDWQEVITGLAAPGDVIDFRYKTK
jgi:hypothetical protein